MIGMQQIRHYFPNLTDIQYQQLEQLASLYQDWNTKINVISRKDMDNFYLHHVQHSMAIKKIINFKAGASVLDLGTGGGFPGIPLAILFPKTNFTLIDGTRKKLKVVEDVALQIGLENVTVIHKRAEELKGKFDFVVSRAVASIDKLWLWSERLLHYQQKHVVPNGLIALKGGNIKAELKLLPKGTYYEINSFKKIYQEDYFAEKCIVYVQA